MSNHRTTEFDIARDELFSHIHRCGVLKASEEQRAAWLEDTKSYLGERHPNLSSAELDELSEIGERFCRPAIPHGPDHTALSEDVEAEVATEAEVEVEEQEMVGSA